MPIPRSVRAASLALLVLGLLPTQPAAAKPEMVIVEVLGERPFAGRVTGAGDTHLDVVPAGKDEARKLPLARVIEVRFPAPEAKAPAPSTHRVTLMDGSVLNGTIGDPEEESFQFTITGVGRARLPFEALRTFVTLPPKVGPCEDLANKYRPEKEGDVVHLQRGDDKIAGMLMDADAERVTFEDARGRSRRVPWKDIRVMHLENDPVRESPGVHAEVELDDGSVLVTAKPPVISGGTLQCALHAEPKAAFKVPMGSVRALRYRGGAFAYLTTLPFEADLEMLYPGGDEETERLERRFKLARVNRRPQNGCPLRLGGKRYAHGFGVVPKSIIRVKLGGQYTSLQALFGIDDSARDTNDPKAANVDARILGDGKVLWEQKDVSLASGPQRIGGLDVKGVDVLELIVDFGKRGFIADRASWVNPIVVRK